MLTNTTVRFIVCLSLFAVILAGWPDPARSQTFVTPAQNPLAGSRVFGEKGCSKCHSINGIGGKVGPDLARIEQNRSFNDVSAAMWNHLPQMTAEARKRDVPFPHLSETEAGDLIAFLFTQNYLNAPGNADSGKKLFTEKSCVQCHQIGGVGGVWGPKLDALAQAGSPIELAAAMWNHGPAMAEAMAARGISRPSLNATDLRNLLAYLKSVARQPRTTPLSVLPGNADDGRELFAKKQCIKCHNIQGSGGNAAPDLGKRGLHRDLVEFAAALWNKTPAMTRAMKIRNIAVPGLNGREMADIVAYLRSFQYFGGPGNAARGRQLFAEKQCTTCHASISEMVQQKRLDSAAALAAGLWNHGGAGMQQFQERNMSWPALSPDDISHLMAFFERTRSER